MKTFETQAPLSAEERQFEVGGETFVARPSVRPEVLASLEQGFVGTAASSLEAIDGLIVSLIEPADGAHERWRALRERDEDPVSFAMLEQIGAWLVEVVTGRPFGSPSRSSDGPGATGTASTDDSRSPALTSTP